MTAAGFSGVVRRVVHEIERRSTGIVAADVRANSA